MSRSGKVGIVIAVLALVAVGFVAGLALSGDDSSDTSRVLLIDRANPRNLENCGDLDHVDRLHTFVRIGGAVIGIPNERVTVVPVESCEDDLVRPPIDDTQH